MIVFLGYLIALAGLLVGMVGELRLMVLAYRHGAGWLFGCMAFPPLWLLLVICHFATMRCPLITTLLGIAGFVIGCELAGVEL